MVDNSTAFSAHCTSQDRHIWPTWNGKLNGKSDTRGSAPRASGKRRGWCYSGGSGNVECTIPGNRRWQKYRQKKEGRSVQCPPAKNGTIGHQKTVEKILKKFQLFWVRSVGVPGIGQFCGIPAGGTERFERRTFEESRSPLARKRTKYYLCQRRMQTWSERGIRTDGSLIW